MVFDFSEFMYTDRYITVLKYIFGFYIDNKVHSTDS